MCQFNTYAPDFGATVCMDCPVTQYALQGQAECLERTDPCDGDDYRLLYTECTESSPGVYTRSRVAEWVDPLFCLLDGSTTLVWIETAPQQLLLLKTLLVTHAATRSVRSLLVKMA